jgi:hypothetical protein
MKTSDIPSHVWFDQNLTIDKFKGFLSSKAPDESKNLFTGKSNNGTLLMHRLTNKADTKLARLSHFLLLGSERNKVRQQIKDLLTTQGIELTAEIRKALPSRFNNGNADKLLEALSGSWQVFEREINSDYKG